MIRPDSAYAFAHGAYEEDDQSPAARAQRRRDKRTVNANGFTLMTPAYLQQLCREQKGYTTPYLNDTLYLHYKGFESISDSLLAYTGLKSLWLENNALSVLQNLDKLVNLKCLYLQDNCLSDFSALSELQELAILNISGNGLLELPSVLKDLPLLSTLHATNNRLRYASSVMILREMPCLTVLDLHHNALEDEQVLDEVLFKCNAPLAVVTLNSNPLLRTTSNYRRRMVAGLQSLTFLDDRPVTEGDRLAINAWFASGAEGEEEERRRQRNEERAVHDRGFAALAALQEANRTRQEESQTISRESSGAFLARAAETVYCPENTLEDQKVEPPAVRSAATLKLQEK